MGSYTVPAGSISAHDKTLVGSTVDTVTFDGTGGGVFGGTPTGAASTVEILSDGTAAIYFTTDGTVPTVSGANTYKLPLGTVSALQVAPLDNNGTIVVKLISAGTPVYSVSIA